MAGIAQKAVWIYFHCGPSKKNVFFGGRGRADVINRNTQKIQKFKFDKKSC